MLIESITIKNFRQFHNEIKLDFSTSKEKNVTVIHGANGSGKTSLLNAFKWCFYGETDFDTRNDNILSELAIQMQDSGSLVDIRIAVRFSHDERRYTAIRSQSFKKLVGIKSEAAGDPVFVIEITEDDGQTKRSPSPSKTLQGILPQNLHPYFFFNGERIEHLAGVNQSVQVADAIRKLMGIEVVDRAINHLGKVKNQYRKLVKEDVNDEQKALYTKIEKLDEDIENYEQELFDATKKGEMAEATKSNIERELKTFEKSQRLQLRRDELYNMIDDLAEQVGRIKKKQKQYMNDYGFLALSENLFKGCTELVQTNREKGVLPYGIKEQFVDDLIEMGSCICGEQIELGSPQHKCLLATRRSAGSSSLELTYTMVSSLLNNQQSEVETFRLEYKDLSSQLTSAVSQQKKLRTELDEVSAQLVKTDDNRIAELERNHQKQTDIFIRSMEDKGIASNGLQQAKADLENEKILLERSKLLTSDQNTVERRLQKAELLIETMNNLRESLSNSVRIELSLKVDETFQSIIRKPVRAIIDEQYRLQVLRKTPDGNEYLVNEQSTGERQITSLSFISSIIATARERHGQDKKFFQGGLYPLVMDSPFGSLDDDYRQKVAGKVSDLAEQVIMFVSNSQWIGKVKEACDSRVGKSYQLVYHSPKLDRSKENDYSVLSENGYEYSTVKEV